MCIRDRNNTAFFENAASNLVMPIQNGLTYLKMCIRDRYYFSDVLTQEWATKDLELRRLIRFARYSCRIQKIDALKKHISEIKRYLKQKESL